MAVCLLEVTNFSYITILALVSLLSVMMKVIYAVFRRSS